MIHLPTIVQAILLKGISWSAAVNRQGTGCLYQIWLLRALGARVTGPIALGSGTTFLGARHLKIGKYVSVGANSRIVSWMSVEIGDDFMASDLLNINDGGHDPVSLKPMLAPIRIGNRVWCGTNVTICAGVEIGDDVIIGAGSVVVKSVAPGWIVAGVPARPLRQIERKDVKLWSLWPERSSGYNMDEAPAFKRWLHWLRARF